MNRGLFLLAFLLVLTLANVSSSENSLIILGDNETIRVDVKLADTQDSGIFRTSSVVDKNDVIEDLKEDYAVEYVAQTFNSLTIEVNQTQLEDLQNREDISQIKRSLEFHALLQDSTSIINATLAGNLQVNGINLTGRGQTVCIIDSGVNYTHPAFGSCTKEQFLSGNCSKVIGGYAYYNPTNSSNLNDIMGDTDHGTHVAGIVAGSGPIRGVAPDAKIVAIKACGPTDSCNGNAIIDGINFCTLNSALYNISAISISIGTSAPNLYSSACDLLDSGFTNAINSATAKNISVIIAAGNDGNATHISFPACISNATAVAAVNKADVLAPFNRNSLSYLVAPGVSIISSVLNGYASDSGTSMSTPHIAGAFLVVRQLLDSMNTTMKPVQIARVLNSTGKQIMDTTGVNYSRINLYSAVLSLDGIPPTILLISPQENLSTLNSNITFSANISDWNITNMTFQLRNSSGNIINETTFNVSGAFNQSSFTIYNLSNGSYNWSFSGVDLKMNFAISTRNLTIGNETNITNSTEDTSDDQNEEEPVVKSRSSGGGGGGGGARVYVADEQQISEGYTKTVGKQEMVQFTLFDAKSSKHTLTVNAVGKDYVNVTVRSDPIRLMLGVGQSAKLNLTSSEFYDLLVRLESIVNGKAQITIQTINEPKFVLPIPSNYTSDFNFTTMDENKSSNANFPVDDEGNLLIHGVILIGAIVLTALIVHAIDLPRRRRLHRALNHKI